MQAPAALETLDVGWFDVHELPPLSLGRVNHRQLERALAHHRDPPCPASSTERPGVGPGDATSARVVGPAVSGARLWLRGVMDRPLYCARGQLRAKAPASMPAGPEFQSDW